MAKLQAASKATGTGSPELAKGTQNLKEAGLSLDEATTASAKLNEVALVPATGTSCYLRKSRLRPISGKSAVYEEYTPR